MDGCLYIQPASAFVLTALTLADLAAMNAAAQVRRRPRRARPSRRSGVIVPPNLYLPLGGEPLILLPPLGACVDPPSPEPVDLAAREARCRKQAEAWALENARTDDYGLAFLYALDVLKLGRKPRTDMLAKHIRLGNFGSGREVSALEFDDGSTVLDRVETPITAGVASADGDVDAMHLGGTVTLAAIRKYTPRWGLEEGHGKDGDWRRPLEHAFHARVAGQLGFAGRLWTARTAGVAA